MTEESGCLRCGACCRVLPLNVSTMSPEYRKYLLNRGLVEEQGFILIPHDCQHLKRDETGIVRYTSGKDKGQIRCLPSVKKYICDIHDSPDRPFVCRKFTGQKQIGRFKIYSPPGCAFNNKS